MNMRMLSVSLLLCAAMALTTAMPLTTAAAGEHEIVKRWQPGCPHGWIHRFGNCYKFERRTMDWAHAEINCMNQGGHLASIHSHAEHKLIPELTGGNVHAWIGGYNVMPTAHHIWLWLWSDGSRMGFTAWHQGEPNNDGGQERCIHYWKRKGIWNDIDCDRRFASVCKIGE